MDKSTYRKHRPKGPMLWKYLQTWHKSHWVSGEIVFTRYKIKVIRSLLASLLHVGVVIFKASALWADAFYKSKCPSVCVCVCSPLRYRLTVFLPPLPEVGCPIFLEIRNPWGKVMERSGLTFEHFCLEVVSNRRWFCLTKHGQNHASRWIRDLWSKGISLILAYL